MGISYNRSEMLSASDVAKHYGQISKKVKQSPQSRVVVIKNNRPDHIILDIEEYEFLQEFYELLEHTEIADIIKARKDNKIISHELVLSKLGISENELQD